VRTAAPDASGFVVLSDPWLLLWPSPFTFLVGASYWIFSPFIAP
jgi:hypothetical protein